MIILSKLLMKDVYENLFSTDDYKMVFFICAVKNSYIQKDLTISSSHRRLLNRKTRQMKNMLRLIIRVKIASLDEYLFITHACASLYAELFKLFSKYTEGKKYRKEKLFKNIVKKDEFVFSTLAGRRTWDIVRDNHALGISSGLCILAFATYVFLSYISTDIYFSLFVLIISFVFLISFLVIFIVNWKSMDMTVRANRIRNKYTYLNSITTKSMRETAKEIISSIKK